MLAKDRTNKTGVPKHPSIASKRVVCPAVARLGSALTDSKHTMMGYRQPQMWKPSWCTALKEPALGRLRGGAEI